jgi:hypothetical protein
MRTLSEAFAVRMAATPATWAAAANYGNWIGLQGYEGALFICGNGELDGNMTVALYEATDDEGAGAQALTGVTESFANGTDEARVGLFEIRADQLTAGFTHVALRCTPGATDSFAGYAVLFGGHNLPASNETTDGVAFVVNADEV